MVKNVLLGLLARGPKHGYELKQDFEDLLGGTWPLNVGQVYTTLGRLERDGLIAGEDVPQDTRPDRRVYSLTEEGRTELKRWAHEPVAEPVNLKDDLLLKVLVHAVLDSGEAEALLWRQRREYMELLARVSGLRSSPATATRLLAEAAVVHIEADLRWLEVCERELTRGEGADGDGARG